ncbi:hypothetical protein FHX08_005522 [Rhizobium sp. BK529]|nr:hypothetical protein [Rhizobium sp. BK529]
MEGRKASASANSTRDAAGTTGPSPHVADAVERLISEGGDDPVPPIQPANATSTL